MMTLLSSSILMVLSLLSAAFAGAVANERAGWVAILPPMAVAVILGGLALAGLYLHQGECP
jgi:hypothetical protein